MGRRFNWCRMRDPCWHEAHSTHSKPHWTPLTPIRISQLASLNFDIPDPRLWTKLHACSQKCTLIKRADLHSHPTLIQTRLSAAHLIYFSKCQLCIAFCFLDRWGLLTQRKITNKLCSGERKKKSAVFWQVHCTRQFSVQNTKRHLSLQLGRKKRGGCEWTRERQKKREEKKIEGKYKGEPAALSLRQCENFSFNPLYNNAACIWVQRSSTPFPFPAISPVLSSFSHYGIPFLPYYDSSRIVTVKLRLLLIRGNYSHCEKVKTLGRLAFLYPATLMYIH